MSIYKSVLYSLSIFAIVFLFNIGFFSKSYASAETVSGNAIVVTSPQKLPLKNQTINIFLAGSIEMGKAIDWQKEFIDAFKSEKTIIYNPRRSDWDKNWKPTLSEPNFKTQVEWELNALEDADIIVMYLAPDTQSPISLLELGLYAKSGKLILYCPEGFWRKGNVDAVAAKYNIQTVNSLEELIIAAKKRLRN